MIRLRNLLLLTAFLIPITSPAWARHAASGNIGATNDSITVQMANQGGTAPPTGGPGATGIYFIWTDGRIYDPSGNVFRARGVNEYYQVGLSATGDLAYMGTPGWNINAVRFRYMLPPSNGIPPAGYLSEVDAYRNADRVIWNDWVNFDSGFHLIAGWPNSSTAYPMDLDAIKEWQRQFAIKYGTAGSTPDERVWYAMVNEPGGPNDAILVNNVAQWDAGRVAQYKTFVSTMINTIRGAGAKAPIIVPSMTLSEDIMSPNWNWEYSFSPGITVDERSSILKWAPDIMAAAPTVTAGGHATKNLCFSVHLFLNYARLDAKDRLGEFLAAANARGICVIFEEWSHCLDTNEGCKDTTPSMNAMRDLRKENGGYYFNEMVYTWDAGDPMNLTTTAPVTGRFSGPDCLVGATSCKDVAGNPTNLTPSGQVLWDGTHGHF